MIPRRRFAGLGVATAACLARATPLPRWAAAPERRRIVYLAGHLSGHDPAALATTAGILGGSGFNVINLAFLIVRRVNGKLHLAYNNTVAGAVHPTLPRLIAQLQSGCSVPKQVMLSIGGWGNRETFNAIRAAGVPAFLDQLEREVVRPWGLDGLDLDLEPDHASDNTPAGWRQLHDDLGPTLAALTNQYKAIHPRHRVSHAPLSNVAAAVYLRGGLLGATRHATGNNIDWLNLQFYEAGAPPAGSSVAAYYCDELAAPLQAAGRAATGVADAGNFLVPGFEPRFHQSLEVCEQSLRGIATRCQRPPGGAFVWQYGQIAGDIRAWSAGLRTALDG